MTQIPRNGVSIARLVVRQIYRRHFECVLPATMTVSHDTFYIIPFTFYFYSFYFFGQILLVGLYVLYASHGRSFWRPRRVGEHDQRHSNRLFDVARFVDITMWVVALRSISSNINIPFSCIVECVYMVYTHFNLVMCASHSARLHACHGLSLSPPFTPPSKKEFMAYS